MKVWIFRHPVIHFAYGVRDFPSDVLDPLLRFMIPGIDEERISHHSDLEGLT